MPHHVTINPSGHRVALGDGETILAGTLREGFILPYGCRTGACGTCKGKLVEGTVDYGRVAPAALTPQERESGLCLFCCAVPSTDVVIEARGVGAARGIVIKTLPCRVQTIERVAPDVLIVRLKLPANERLGFLAGQYLEFLLKDGTRRSFSMANPPHDAETLELHLRNYGGSFSRHAFGVMKERDILRFEAPLGTFFLREDSAKPIVLVASGTGFAPIKAIVEHALHKGVDRPMTLYWGGRRPADLYRDTLCRGWADTHSGFRYVPVVSDALPEDAWAGRTGLVHAAVMADLPDLSAHQVYACGNPLMVDAARGGFTAQCGLPPDEFFADAFTPAA